MSNHAEEMLSCFEAKIEAEYIRAVQLQQAKFGTTGIISEELQKNPAWTYGQGAIETLEEIMHEVKPDEMWAFDALKRNGLLNTDAANTVGSGN